MSSIGHLEELRREVSVCRVCAEALPHEPRPVMRLERTAKVIVIGQAPGAKVHESGVPWNDDSGERLLEWLDVTRAEFEDASVFGIVPMGFCWPGRRKGGDLPPRPECAPLWHPRLLAGLAEDRLTLLVGSYAQKYYLGKRAQSSLTATVGAFESYLPTALPLPHPAWRSRLWMKKNPWFRKDVLPRLRSEVRARLVEN